MGGGGTEVYEGTYTSLVHIEPLWAIQVKHKQPGCVRLVFGTNAMRPPYILLLASPHDPRVSGFCSPPSPFVPQHPAPKLQLRSGHAAPSRRTARTSSTPAASCGRTHHETTRQRGSTLGAVGAARRNRPLRWIGRSASARLAQHASSHRSSRASSSTGSGERGPRSASAVPNDPTAASHAYLSEFLGMTEEVSTCYTLDTSFGGVSSSCVHNHGCAQQGRFYAHRLCM